MSHYVYILECADGTLYTGYTTDIERRLEEHNGNVNKPGAKYTNARRPVVLKYVEKYKTNSVALKREYEIKHSLSREEKLKLISAQDKSN